jgi:hypothetical protein
MCWFAQGHMLRFQDECGMLMSRVDVPRYGERCRITPRQRLQVALFPLRMRLHSMLPGYTPYRHHVPESIARLSAHFSALAENVR